MLARSTRTPAWIAESPAGTDRPEGGDRGCRQGEELRGNLGTGPGQLVKRVGRNPEPPHEKPYQEDHRADCEGHARFPRPATVCSRCHRSLSLSRLLLGRGEIARNVLQSRVQGKGFLQPRDRFRELPLQKQDATHVTER